MKKLKAKGVSASQGIVTGRVIIVLDPAEFNQHSLLSSDSYILVTKYTNPDFEIIMYLCRGYISEKGGITNHLAIVARELGRPAVVGVENATRIFQNGMKIRLNAITGEIFVIEET